MSTRPPLAAVRSFALALTLAACAGGDPLPTEAAAPALVIVGFLLITQVRNIDFDDYAIAIPAFLTIVLMPFTYSITNGIGAGFVSYALLMATQGRAREVSPLLWIIAALFLVYFGIGPIEAALVD